MHCIFPVIYFSLAVTISSVNGLSGPYLFWGHQSVFSLQPRALVEVSEDDLTNLFQNVKAIVVFVRNSTGPLDGKLYPKFQPLVKSTAWAYLPQHALVTEPFNYNANIEVINLGGTVEDEDEALISGYDDAVTIYGKGEVLGILASREEDTHFIGKRDAKEREDRTDEATTTSLTPTAEEEDKSFIYVALGNKAVLYVTSAPIINITGKLNNTKLVSHNKDVTFDDQKGKGYGRLNIIFSVDTQKLFLRFNFTLSRGYWYMKAVEVEYNDFKSILPVLGSQYSIPSAPIGFSYRCSSRILQFGNDSDTLTISDFQVQPWLNGAPRFGDVYDCVGFTTAPIWAGILVTFFLIGILSIGLIALMEIKTPNRFESSRSKQLSLYVQE
ncbi:V-type proton ATPase subunit S1 [Eurosta solidaginis]|uniref:V-type proton ATPase subunit S1 n=1 Tax=Eurosta solidaginis TaxID=178769 RepID=UPI003531487C